MTTFNTELILRGTRAAQPAAASSKRGAIYCVTDEGRILERVDDTGTSWESFSPAAPTTPKLDDLAAPDDNTDLNASTSAHGLLKKLDNNSAHFLDGQGNWSTPAGGSGNSTSTGAVGSEPGSPTTGDIYLPNNGFGLERYSGSAWVPWGPLFPFAAPVNGDFAWVNQGSASVTTTNGGIFLRAPVSSGVNLRLRKKSAPATPYTITAAFLPSVVASNYQSCGLFFRESGSGKLETWETNASTGSFQRVANRFTDATTYSATAISIPDLRAGGLCFLRIGDDGANRKAWVSADGQNWILLFTVARTTFLTANEVGFFVNDQTNTYEVGMTLLSWVQA